MKVCLVDHTSNPTERIGLEAAICYDASTDPDACIRRAVKCKDYGHLATMRFAYATIHVEGVSRVCSHQLVRMAHAGILQESQRYVKQSNVQYVVPEAVSLLPESLQGDWFDILHNAKELYEYLVDQKLIKKEDARYILPQACMTSLHLCLNFQAWQDFLKNRLDSHAQWEIREVAEKIQECLHSIAPEIF